MATQSSILAWKIPWTERPGGFQSMGSQRDVTERLNTHTTLWQSEWFRLQSAVDVCIIAENYAF